MLIEKTELTDFVAAIFTAAGASDAFAAKVAKHLVAANLKGHDSHGVGMVPAYVGNIRNGHLQVDAEATDLFSPIIDAAEFVGQQLIHRRRLARATHRKHREPSGDERPQPSLAVLFLGRRFIGVHMILRR